MATTIYSFDANNAVIQVGSQEVSRFTNASTGIYQTFPALGYAAPSLTTRSIGTKVVIYPAISGSTVDYAIGVDASTLWFSTPDNSTCGIKWYNGTTNTMTLAAGGALSITGAFVASGNVTAFSDERLKKDWTSLSNDYVEKLSQVKVGTFTRIDSGERQVGVSAQSLQQILPEAVVSSGDTLAVAYGNAALASVVELAKRVVEQDKRIKQLEDILKS